MINYNWRSHLLLFFKRKIKSQSGFYLNSCERYSNCTHKGNLVLGSFKGIPIKYCRKKTKYGNAHRNQQHFFLIFIFIPQVYMYEHSTKI
jgi:hypothetical protein